MNSVTISGNLARDPEIKDIGSGKVCEFTIAVSDRYKQGDEWKERTHWIGCVAWGWLVDKIGDRAHKGDGCVVMGSLTQESWEDKETGKKREKTKVTVREFEITQRAPKREGAPVSRKPAPDPDLDAPDDQIPY